MEQTPHLTRMRKQFDKKTWDGTISYRVEKNSMKREKQQIEGIASQYGLQIIYAFGSIINAKNTTSS